MTEMERRESMNKIPSFTVDHLRLLTGVYVSRKDVFGHVVLTTFDLRFTKPNTEPVMDTAAVHAIEHLAATWLRNQEQWKERVVYFGPMGCRTGFYLILEGDLEPEDIHGLLWDMCRFILDFQGDIPGAAAKDCGNYLDMNLSMAKYHTDKFKREVLEDFSHDRTHYPE